MMKITADILEQARETLVSETAQKITLLAAIKEQGRKITELEREVQRQMTARAAAEQALQAARRMYTGRRSFISFAFCAFARGRCGCGENRCAGGSDAARLGRAGYRQCGGRRGRRARSRAASPDRTQAQTRRAGPLGRAVRVL